VQQQAGIVSSALLSHLCYVVSHIYARLSTYPQLRVPPYGYRPRFGLMTPLPAAMSGPESPIPPPPTPEQAAAMAAAAQRFYNELWILLGVGSLVTILRTIARVRKAGLRKLYGDDVLALVALIFYGIESGLAYSVGAHARGLANNGMTDAHRAALPTNSEEYRLRTKGSIIQLAGWSSYSLVLWTLKASWLFFYLRLTEGLSRQYRTRIYVGFFFVIGTWAAGILNLLLDCRPFRHYWQINPDPGTICQPAVSNGILWAWYGLNVVSDVYLLSIPLPLLWTTRLKNWKRFALVFLFSGGIFVMVCATIRSVLVLTDPINGAQTAGSWAVRETFVALVTTNLPHIFPLLKTWFEPVVAKLSGHFSSNKKSEASRSRQGFRTFGGGGSTGPSWRGRGPPTANPITDFTRTESEERIVSDVKLQDLKMEEESPLRHSERKTDIHRSVEVQVMRENRLVPTRSPISNGSADGSQPWLQRDAEHTAYARGPSPHGPARHSSR
jgi:hypothetical protein